jgi:hypothetical protein
MLCLVSFNKLWFDAERDGLRLGSMMGGMFVLDKLGYCLGMLSPDQSFEGGAWC